MTQNESGTQRAKEEHENQEQHDQQEQEDKNQEAQAKSSEESNERAKTEPMMTCLFRDPEKAELAYHQIRARGYSDDDITILMSEETRDEHWGDREAVETTTESKVAEGTAVGGVTGGAIGAIVAGVAAVAFPGLGLVAVGPIAAALAGAGAGALSGGLIGALVGMGLSEETAKLYQDGISEGGTVIGLQPKTPEDAALFEQEWGERFDGEHISR